MAPTADHQTPKANAATAVHSDKLVATMIADADGQGSLASSNASGCPLKPLGAEPCVIPVRNMAYYYLPPGTQDVPFFVEITFLPSDS